MSITMDNLESPHEDTSLESLLPPSLGSRVPELTRLVQVMTCSICYEMMVQPMSTSCLHSFCSLCVRGSLQYRQQCPLCHNPEYEAKLRQNRTMETLLQLIRPLVRSVSRLVEGDDRKENADPNCPTVPPDFPYVPTPSGKSTLKDSQERQTMVEQVSRANTDSTLPLAVETSTSKTEKSSCHVCNVQVAKKNLNLHLDRCMKSAQKNNSVSDNLAGTPNSPKTIKLPPLPKLIYTLLKDAQLKKKCKEFGLEAKGDRQTLVGRLRRFTLLYNNEAQLEKPRSVRLLAQQVEREEREEKQARVEIPLLLQYNKNTEEKVREEKQNLYLKQNKSSFETLISQVKNRPMKKDNKENDNEAIKSNADLIMETVELLEEASVDSVIDLVDSEQSLDGEEPTRAAEEEEVGKRRISFFSLQTDSPAKKVKHTSVISDSKHMNNTGSIEFKNTADNSDFKIASCVSESKQTTINTDVKNKSCVSDDLKQISMISDVKLKTLVSDLPLTGSLDLPGVSRTIENTNEYSNPSPKTIKISRPVAPKVPSRGKKKSAGNSKSDNIINQLNKSSQQSRSGPKVSCPVCGTLVAEKLLNLHLDRCLKSSNSPVIPRRSNVKKPKEESDTESELSQSTLDFSDSDDDDDLSLVTGDHVRTKHPRAATSKDRPVWEMGVISQEVEDMEEGVGELEVEWPQDVVEAVYSFEPKSPGPLEPKYTGPPVPPTPPSPSLLDPVSPPSSPLFNKYTVSQQSETPLLPSSPLYNKYSVSQQSIDPILPSSPLYIQNSASRHRENTLLPASPLSNNYMVSKQSVNPLLPSSPIYNKHSVSQQSNIPLLPSSPFHTMNTGSQQSDNPLPCSEPDMFESDEESKNRPSSGNLLDLRDDIDKMVEEAISKEEKMKMENYENMLPKQKVFKVIPKKRQKRLLISLQDNLEITCDKQETKYSPSSETEIQSGSVSSLSGSVSSVSNVTGSASSVSNVSVRLTRRSTRQSRTKLI